MPKEMIETADGVCATEIFRREGNGPWPAVILFMDGLGIRPSLRELAQRLASHGYVVALPDLFYRSGPYDAESLRKLIFDPAHMAEWRQRYYAPAIDPAHVQMDTGALLAHLRARADVKAGGVGTTGYCMGGNISLRAAGLFPEVAACASFHGGALVTDRADSPHLLAPRIKARVYIAGAVQDPSFTDDNKRVLADALTAAGVTHRIETYEGALHGWVPNDSPRYNAGASERAFKTLVEFFAETL